MQEMTLEEINEVSGGDGVATVGGIVTGVFVGGAIIGGGVGILIGAAIGGAVWGGYSYYLEHRPQPRDTTNANK